ncbi:hypothetical protein DERF_009026 [Dermatophagoides farinae]|uniref:Uncharacterized protein n=1 Tax=Dermatophagoides farinae TaxID=6954 RepID=A0A922L3L5_DERFA|nr:hypothetical protein DERF_009026 [Dermatophagoides farinae]
MFSNHSKEFISNGGNTNVTGNRIGRESVVDDDVEHSLLLFCFIDLFRYVNDEESLLMTIMVLIDFHSD